MDDRDKALLDVLVRMWECIRCHVALKDDGTAEMWELTSALRWNGLVLEQCWLVRNAVTNTNVREVWRPVPEV